MQIHLLKGIINEAIDQIINKSINQMNNEQWMTNNGQWTTNNGKWATNNERRTMDNEQWTLNVKQLSDRTLNFEISLELVIASLGSCARSKRIMNMFFFYDQTPKDKYLTIYGTKTLSTPMWSITTKMQMSVRRNISICLATLLALFGFFS